MIGDWSDKEGAITALRGRAVADLDERRQALKELENAVGEVRLRLLAEPEETESYCRQLLQQLAASDKAPGRPLEEKWQRRRDALEMSLTNFLAQALVEVGDWAGAVATYERCLDLGARFQMPEFQADSLLKLGSAQRQAGTLDEAQQSYERAATLSSLYGLFTLEAEALYQQALVAELQEQLPTAFELYRQGLKLSEGQRLHAMSIRFMAQLGQLHQDEADYTQALDYYQRCLYLLRETDNDPESETVLLGQISHICTEIADFETGRTLAEEGLALARQTGQHAEEEAFLSDLARLYRQQGDYEQARHYAQELHDHTRQRGNGRSLQTAELLLEQIEQSANNQSISEPGEPLPRSAALYYLQGNRYYHKGAFERAISAYNRAIRVDPNLASAYVNRGSAYAMKGQYDRALADYNRAIELNNTDATMYFNRGNAYRKRREYQRALADYTAAIRLAPSDPDAYFNRGEVLRRLNRHDEAIQDFHRVLQLSTGRDEAGARQARQILKELLDVG